MGVQVSPRAPNSFFSLDLSRRCVDYPIMSDVVKCPICNAKVPFSLQMHMHMHTLHGPGGRPEEETPYPIAPPPSARTKEKRKGPHPGKRHQRKGGGRRPGH